MGFSTTEFLKRQSAFERLPTLQTFPSWLPCLAALFAMPSELRGSMASVHVSNDLLAKAVLRASLCILVEGAMALPVTHGGGVPFAS